MARKVIWLPPAADELEDIHRYVSADSPTYAATLARQIVEATRDLSRFPRMGRQVPDWHDEDLRERIIGSYRVIYQVMPERIVILSIIHGARLLPPEVRRRKR